jgi:spore coat polysaccharide biosynthesis protein SpsF
MDVNDISDAIQAACTGRNRAVAYSTKQESLWAGEFGTEYIPRNAGAHLVAANVALLASIFRSTRNVGSVFEVGANVGNNLQAVRQLLPNAELGAIEINESAHKELKRLVPSALLGSIIETMPESKYDFVFTKGVLIHIHPESLTLVYDRMVALTRRYLCVIEYYNPSPVSVSYRGHEDALFKRDFAGELLERHPLRLVDYGFVYRRDPNFPQDDLTWFLLALTS